MTAEEKEKLEIIKSILDDLKAITKEKEPRKLSAPLTSEDN